MPSEASRKITKEFEIPLTVAEIADMATTAAAVSEEIKEKERAFDVVKKKHGAEIKEREERVAKILSTVHAKKALRSVPCTQKLDYNSATVRFIAEDGVTVLEERAMTPEEMQQEMFEKTPQDSEDEEKVDEQLPLDDQIAQDIRESTSRSTASSAVQ